MTARLSAENRRSQLIEAGLTVAARSGISAVTVREIAEHAHVSLGVVHYCFENKEALVTAMGEALIAELGSAVSEALTGAMTAEGQSAAGPRALRESLHRGVAALWSVVEKTADRQLLTYEITAYSVRSEGCGPEIGTKQYHVMDAETGRFLIAAAAASSMRWTEPMASLTRSALATIDGVVLRWLVDNDTLAVIAELDDLAARIATKAVPA
ncbi:MAG: TetR/AcrR family transcriptional regulator [Rhodococcus sp. (in: high G+C Gram-positive bacteria)]